MIVKYTFSANEIIDMAPPVPVAVQMRMKLNQAGFKFEDDGKFSVATNEYPLPKGNLTIDTDPETGDRLFTQELCQ